MPFSDFPSSTEPTATTRQLQHALQFALLSVEGTAHDDTAWEMLSQLIAIDCVWAVQAVLTSLATLIRGGLVNDSTFRRLRSVIETATPWRSRFLSPTDLFHVFCALLSVLDALCEAGGANFTSLLSVCDRLFGGLSDIER